jgi:fermentation-respiration switch protein FrsA (DUF1100 family)
MLVVSGAADTMPTPEQARTTATRAPAGESLLIEGGDHLLGNTRWQWLDRTADWLVERLM